MLATMNHWVKFLRVFFGGCILLGMFTLGSGRVPNGMPFPRPIAVSLTEKALGKAIFVKGAGFGVRNRMVSGHVDA